MVCKYVYFATVNHHSLAKQLHGTTALTRALSAAVARHSRLRWQVSNFMSTSAASFALSHRYCFICVQTFESRSPGNFHTVALLNYMCIVIDCLLAFMTAALSAGFTTVLLPT